MAGEERRISRRLTIVVALAAGATTLSVPPACRAQAGAPTIDPEWSRAQAAAPARSAPARDVRQASGAKVDASDARRRPTAPVRPSAFTAAVTAAWKKGVIEDGVDGYTDVLIACQQEQSTLQTTPFMRSDSQQAHCFRY